MRNEFAMVFVVLIVAMIICTLVTRRSRKAIARQVRLLLISLLPPLIGNLLIIASDNRLAALIGCYTYYVGMDFVVYALLAFTLSYCYLSWPRGMQALTCVLLGLDAAQLLCNPFFHHAFGIEVLQLDGFDYYRMVPLLGQTIHRLVDYGILAVVLVIFIVKLIRSPRIHSERYWVILVSLLAFAGWESYYIFSRAPVDRSMIGFGVFGLLVNYFALHYRPMRLLDRLLAGIASQLPEALFFFDANGRCIWANLPGSELTDVDNQDFEPVAARLAEKFGVLDPSSDWVVRRVLGKGDSARYYTLEKHTQLDEHGKTAGSFLSVRDNTEEQMALQREKYIARHDQLTGIFTREHLYRRIGEKLKADRRTKFLIVFVDVKDFKIVNDIFGSAFGDLALQRVAAWVAEGLSKECLYGRLAGDTFGVCMPADQFMPERIEEKLSQFVVRDGEIEHHILIHLGVYEVTEPELEVSVMFDRAHMALATIKNDYQKHIAWYDDAMRRQVLWSQRITSQLSEALEQRQVRPYLQPIVDAEGRVLGAEALVRWIHPTQGFLSPAAFVPVFENNGMIAQVDKYMWRCACELLARWKDARPDLFVSVNISPKDFYFMDVAAELRGIVAEFGIEPSRLRVEITETVMMTNVEQRMGMLKDLRRDGFMVEIDDFGSGYSSLNMLKDMPVDVLKIDMAFLTKTDNEDKARMIVRNVIHMTQELGIESLTEGVETEEQWRTLAEMGCQLYQGYYFAKPMPVEDFEAYCDQQWA